MTRSATSSCACCERAWRHCHETWIAHVDGGECTAPEGCVEPVEAHDLVVLCHELAPPCSCADTP